MKKSDPFQVEPLPKAFYYPSKEKELTKKEKKVCLSAPAPEQHKVTSPEDLKFLKDTNALKVQEIPTRENGSFGDQSSSSQFNESWPSTEQNGSHSTMVSDVTSPEMSQQMKEWLAGKPDKPVTKSTLGWYINRFRNAPPTSRQIRDKSSFTCTNQKQGDFWWLSPPSGQSTPMLDTPPEKLKPSPSKGPLKKASKLPASTSSPSLFHTSSDRFTEDLNTRAKELLERSETSIDSTSTEPFPLPLKKPVLIKTRTPKTVPKQTSSTPDPSTKLPTPTPNPTIQSTHKNPWPEDDILYQWRLARKMEKAQERATAERPGRPLGLSSSTQRLLNSRDRICQASGSALGGSTGLQLPEHSELFTLPEAPFVAETILDSHTPVCASTTNILSPTVSSSTSVFTTASTATRPIITSLVSPPCRHQSRSVNHGEVPPHMHLACDILPCHCLQTNTKTDLKSSTAELPHQRSVVLNENHIKHFNSDSELENKRLIMERSSYLQQDVGGSKVDYKDPSSTSQTIGEPVVITRKKSDELNKNKKEDRVDKRDFERERSNSESSVGRNKEQGNSNISLEENEKLKTFPKMKRRNKKKQETIDVVDNIIGKVVSEHLFNGELSSGENESHTSELILQPEREDTKHSVEPTTLQQDCLQNESSEEEFTEDEILKMLRQRSRDLKHQLREIDRLILDNK